VKIQSLADLKNWIEKQFQPQLTAKSIVLLSGKMGAGKTQFVKTYCELAKSKQPASSPTFSIIQEYDSAKNKIYHIDLYRIESDDELENTGFWEIFEKPAQIFIEWPDKMPKSRLPKDWKVLNVEITHTGNDRTISLT
jgi:tRNA threonylcarbamoyladenosine biosynthesis protein TsaE